jgi:hypothetical protein
MRLGINDAGLCRIANQLRRAAGGVKVVDALAIEKGDIYYFSDGCVMVYLAHALTGLENGDTAFMLFDSTGKPFAPVEDAVRQEEQTGGESYNQAVQSYYADATNKARDQETQDDSSWFQVLKGYIPQLQEMFEKFEKEKHEQENEGHQQENEEYERPENVRM